MTAATALQASAPPPPQPRPPGRWWQQLLQPFAAPLPYRACDLCDHGIDIGGIRHCVCADAVLPAHPVPVHIVRAPHGPCGTEARHLAFPGLNGR